MNRPWYIGAWRNTKRFLRRVSWKNLIFIGLSVMAIGAGLCFLWLSTLTLPNIESFNERRIGVSTKIYDNTGKIVLFDLNQNTRRTVVKNEEISKFVKDATIAIEDENFYNHHGIEPLSILRAVFVNIINLGYEQGGSTITQQVVKNALLTTDKKISRKVKEWFLAPNLERIMSKDEILNIYLNENPYGSNIYGIEEASQAFFGKTALSVSLAEAAYLAALPQAPTYYSPYGNHKEDLDSRKNLVLSQMKKLGMITEKEFESAKAEEVVFSPQQYVSIKAPHFVMYVKEQLEETYGAEALATMGLNVVTTLDYEMQQEAERIVKEWALKNDKNVNAENSGLIAIDPRTGAILSMVGSRDYFDPAIDGNFNITTAQRQPGSTIKPFIYASAFLKGYEPETVVFDLPTEFSANCSPQSVPATPNATCYSPENYDLVYQGPISLRSGLAQSKNVVSVKTLYLAGIKDSIRVARDMGLTTLSQNADYGLTLVLGGGEVTLLDLVSGYSVFANEGVRHEKFAIQKITDKLGNTLEEHELEEKRVLPENIALKISDILSDNNARLPSFSPTSPLYFPGRSVAAKTGTTNDYRDVWTVGYVPSLAVGVWAGNNNNEPIGKRVAGAVISPMWHEFMEKMFEKIPDEPFKKPIPTDPGELKPVIAGQWMVPVTNQAPIFDMDPNIQPLQNGSYQIHEILHYVDKNDPLGPAPQNPAADSQYYNWEYPVQIWAGTNLNQNSTSTNQNPPLLYVPIPRFEPDEPTNNNRRTNSRN
ncbi:MAG TPA: transglycosylase domain-containing protein [Candidatus Paceibacterota bacterium]|nr:transglycosylase domain-containing protein [Candidatus Paceibacterota bacterium]